MIGYKKSNQKATLILMGYLDDFSFIFEALIIYYPDYTFFRIEIGYAYLYGALEDGLIDLE